MITANLVAESQLKLLKERVLSVGEPVVRFRVTSRKLTAFKFISQVILRSKSSLKIFMKSFFILSV